MLAAPQVPKFGATAIPDITGSLMSFPVTIEASPLVLAVLTSLAGVFIAIMTVVLVYHWRRFPFEHEIFRTAERIYLGGVAVFLAIAVVGILIS